MAETETLKVGDEAPDFELPNGNGGEKFKLSDHRGKNAVVINFVPFAFSGVCSQQLPLVEQKRADFSAQDAVAVAISCDHQIAQDAWKQQMGIELPILSDFYPHGAVSQSYGVFLPKLGVANRVVVVVGKDGKVAWIQPSEKLGALPDYDPVMACSKA